MDLKSKIIQDLKEAMKKGDQEKVGILRYLNSVIHNKEIEKYAKEHQSKLTEDELLIVLSSELKKRRESVEIFIRSGRSDLAEKERKEMMIIENYLPRQLSREEIEQEVEKIFKNHPGLSDFGSAMKEVMKELKGKADAKIISEIVKSKFN